MTIQFKKDLSYRQFEDLICCSLEGASNYWYWLKRDEFEKDLTSTSDLLACRIASTLYNDSEFKINVYDYEDESELLGVIDYKSCQRGLGLLASNYPAIMWSILEETYDAEDADIFFQLSVMGEIVFG